MNQRRVAVIYIIFLFFSFLIALRLYMIADSRSNAVDVLSGQYSRKYDIISRKGFVFDRKGKILDCVDDGYVTFVDPCGLSYNDCYELSAEFSKYGEKNQSYYYEKLLKGAPFTFKSSRKICDDLCISFEKYTPDDTGFLCHLIGYRNHDGIGMSGVLGVYDKFLSEYSSGNVYARYYADAKGKSIDRQKTEINDIEYSEKSGVYLTIDSDIQRLVEGVAEESIEKGAVVVQDTRTGEILASASMPAFNKSKVSEYLESENGELLNRCLLGYTPGSVFKTVVAVAALEEYGADAMGKYECTGMIEIDGQIIKCHNLSGHGELDLKGAFAQSCNPYFINLGCKLGNEKIIEYAQKLGIGKYDSVNLLKMSVTVLPKENPNYISVAANTSVGQGELLVTPIEICSMMSAVATGIYHKPSLVLKLVSTGGEKIYGSDKGERVIDKAHVAVLGEMLLSCVRDGTGYRACSDVVNCAGKTATAQSGQIKDGQEVIHSWFCGYFPAEDPRYTICVLCDGNGTNKHPSAIFREIAEGLCRQIP